MALRPTSGLRGVVWSRRMVPGVLPGSSDHYRPTNLPAPKKATATDEILVIPTQTHPRPRGGRNRATGRKYGLRMAIAPNPTPR